ncbi:secretin N-terminal domain-containing protein [Nibricoccus sp. IMCC34717]|uniref:secretin N-terminal domain-containing protein n=1 Tax=Nibricoccus sp. IMCC34717 TaxID=3034021 RepID=UPI00384CB273
MKTKLSLIALVGLAATCGSVRAQDAASQTPAAPAVTAAPALAGASEPAPAPAHTADAAEAKQKETLSVDFPDDEVRNILRNVADLFELNLVIPDTLQGKTSVKLRDVTWRQIFKVVLNPVGYTYVEEGNIIRVVTMDSLNLEPAVTEVFVLNYAKASDVKPSLDSLVDAKVGGKIVVDARSNSLIVTERPSALNRIKPIIAKLDTATDQVMIETKFIDVTDGDQKNIGVNWASLQGFGVGTEGKSTRAIKDDRLRKDENGVNGQSNNQGGSTSNSSNSNTSSLTTSQRNLEPGFLADSKARADQITGANIEPVPSSIRSNPDGTYSTVYDLGGTSTRTAGNSASDGSTASSTSSSTLNALQSLGFTNSLTTVSNTVLSADQFRVILSALTSLNRSKLVSNPTIVTLNNTEASINIGREYPIPNYTYNQERGVFEVSGFQYKPIGVILKVTPQVNNAGFIRLTVEPEVSSSNESVSFGGSGGASIPIIQVRKTRTQITLKDGFTLGIGGLVEQTKSNSENKVPLLGDIPGLGRLFRSKSSNTAVHNLVVFITAKTVKPDGASIGEIFDPRMTRSMEIEKGDMPGYRDGSDPYYDPAKDPKLQKDKKKKQ